MLDIRVGLKVYGQVVTTYRISELAEHSGVPATTLRFYEAEGLLPAGRSPNGYRVYDDVDAARLSFITSGKHLGLTLLEIAELLDVHDEGVCAHVQQQLRPLVAARLTQTSQRIAELSAFERFLSGVHADLGAASPEGACGPGCGCLVEAPTPIELSAPTGARLLPMLEDVPVACSLGGGEVADRIADWQAALDRTIERTSVPGGLALTFPAEPELVAEVARLCAEEKECCSFYDFALRFNATDWVLEVRAPAAASELMSELFGEAS